MITDPARRSSRHAIKRTDQARSDHAELRRVNEVLRAASAYFASEIGPTRRWS